MDLLNIGESLVSLGGSLGFTRVLGLCGVAPLRVITEQPDNPVHRPLDSTWGGISW